MIGRTIYHYTLTAKLGEGGMGVVYLAEDTRLGRKVALKFLPRETTDSEQDRQRFEQEAQAAARLNHPNICTIHHFDEHEGRPFLVMEYVEGTTLRERVKQGPLPAEEALDYGAQIIQALAEAHEAGVIHRDVKPGNIMVDSRGRVKVMDFGLAKLHGTEVITKTGSTVGTMGYMAPEQIQGREVDRRADIFSFGVVLFEMLTGSRPFRGEHEAALMYSIVNEKPARLDHYISDPPDLLTTLIDRLLAKEPSDRFQNATDVLQALEQIQSGAVDLSPFSGAGEASDTDPSRRDSAPAAKADGMRASDEPSSTTITLKIPHVANYTAIAGVIVLVLLVGGIGVYALSDSDPVPEERVSVAVADFSNQTGEAELDGLSGMLITALEESERLSVFPRSRMFDELSRMGMNDVETIDESIARQVAQQAGVDALVEASIRRLGGVYIIDMKIMDPVDGTYLFSAIEEGEGQESILRMLDRLSERIRSDFRGERIERVAAEQQVEEMVTSNLQAYHHYFQGQQHIHRMRFEEAIEELEQAVELDPEFGVAWYYFFYALNWEGRAGADEALDNALRYIDRMPEKYQLLVRAWEAPTREEQLEYFHQVNERFPEEKHIVFMIGDQYFHLGKFGESIPYFRDVLDMDPSNLPALNHIAAAYWVEEDFESMHRYARQYVEHAEDYESYRMLIASNFFREQFDEALDVAQEASRLYPRDPEMRRLPAEMHLYRHELEDARTALDEFTGDEADEHTRLVGYLGMTSWYLMQGRYEEGIDALESAYEPALVRNDSAELIMYHALRAYLFAFEGYDRDAARAELEKIDTLYDHLTTLSRIPVAWTYLELGDAEEGLEVMPEVVAEPDILKEAYLHLQRDNAEEAIELFEYLMTRGYNYFNPFLYELLRAYEQVGDLENARRIGDLIQRSIPYDQYSAIAEYDLAYPLSLYRLGVMHHEAGDTERASGYLSDFLSLWGDGDDDLPQIADARHRLEQLTAAE